MTDGYTPFDCGELAYEAGLELSDNPFCVLFATEDHCAWVRGWRHAWWGECGDNPMTEGADGHP